MKEQNNMTAKLVEYLVLKILSLINYVYTSKKRISCHNNLYMVLSHQRIPFSFPKVT